jgi:hypothetical protein
MLGRMAPPAKTVAACALIVAALFAGCEKKEMGTEEEPAREGLALDLGGIDYNVFITRELNPQVPPDNAYYKGPLAKKGEALYGVFLEACNTGTEPLPTASRFKVIDNQGNEFEPTPLPETNDFAYRPIRLDPDECQPEAGSVAQLGPTAASMLLFTIPISNTENRPLELEVEAPEGVPDAEPKKLIFELDI